MKKQWKGKRTNRAIHIAIHTRDEDPETTKKILTKEMLRQYPKFSKKKIIFESKYSPARMGIESIVSYYFPTVWDLENKVR